LHGVEGRHLLLIDDEDLVILAFREYLVRSGCRVDSARDLPTARRCLADGEYSDVWLDLQLTGNSTTDCLRFLSEARSAAPEAKIIAVSGYASEQVQFAADAAGADYFLQKPFDARAVAAAMFAA
jgi:two-component system response regulator RegA